MSRQIDLNADLGEGFPHDADLLRRVSSASVCCGAHAGDDATIRRTLEFAAARGVVVGAHPGYPDREGFGRRDLDLDPAAIARTVEEQVSHLKALALGVGVPVGFVKPHGAMYNQARHVEGVAAGLIDGLKPHGLPVVGQPGGRLEDLARRAGLRFVGEGFIDRAYRPDGSLVPRDQPGAVLHDPAAIEAQVLGLIDRGFATLCVHGDNADSVRLADLVLGLLARAGVAVRGFA